MEGLYIAHQFVLSTKLLMVYRLHEAVCSTNIIYEYSLKYIQYIYIYVYQEMDHHQQI